MKINQQNYVDEAEKVIKGMVQTDRNGNSSADMQSRVQYLKMRIAYEAGREPVVYKFVEQASLLSYVSEIGKDRQKLLLFCDYMEALTAYHRFYGGRES